MRFIYGLILLVATPLHAWEFSATQICALTHATQEISVRVTYDPRVPEYTIALTRLASVWSDAPVFTLRFDGPHGKSISTTTHRLSEDGATLTVTDSGFGNVLDGLELNDSATALVGVTQVTFPLSGADTAVQAFRTCVVSYSPNVGQYLA